MSAILSSHIGDEYASAVNKDSFFTKDTREIIKAFEKREYPPIGKPGESCKTNLFFGFFFDGTKNNYRNAEASNSHSNVARLYDCYPGKGVPGVLPADTDWKHPGNYSHFFKVYAPGVSSPFDRVGDSGEGWDGITGGAAGKNGRAQDYLGSGASYQ